MAKISGVTVTSVTIDDATGTGRDITNDILSWDITDTRAMQDVTGVDKSAPERVGLLIDGKLNMVTAANFATNRAHAVLSTYASSQTRTVVIVLPGPATWTCEMLISSYGPMRDAAGKLEFKVSLEECNGTAPAWS